MAFKPNQVRNVWIDIAGLDEFVTQLAQEKNGRTPKYSHEEIRQRAKKRFHVDITRRALSKHLVKKGLQRMALADLLKPKQGFAQDVRRPAPKHPEGWEPHVEIVGDKATAITKPMEVTPDEKMLIEGFDLSVDEWMVVGPIGCRRWQANVPVEENSTDCRCTPKQSGHHYEERWLKYFKASLVRRSTTDAAEVADLTSVILKHKPVKKKPLGGDVAFAVAIADPQIGKHDQGGVVGTVNRFIDDIGRVQDRARDLRAIGVPIGPLYVFGMGDIIEDCSERYPMQAFTVELNLRDQMKAARRLLADALRAWAPSFEQVVVAAVGGNHGENRRDGKAFTSFSDNADVAIFETLEEVFAENQDAFGHMSFVLPDDRLDLTLDVKGTITTLAHGHQAGRGSTPAQKLDNWWMQQAHGMQPAGDSSLLLSGHYHHLNVVQTGQKTHIQCPALEGGSDWWRNVTGQRSAPGLLTMTIGKEHVREEHMVGWDNLQVV